MSVRGRIVSRRVTKSEEGAAAQGMQGKPGRVR